MGIPLEQYDQIFTRHPRQAGPGDEAYRPSPAEDKMLDDAWSELAEDLGVKQLANQPSEAEIKAFKG